MGEEYAGLVGFFFLIKKTTVHSQVLRKLEGVEYPLSD